LENFHLLELNFCLKRKKEKNKMGQKTNPNIFQLNKTESWDSKYIEKKSNDFYLHTAKDLEIKKFIDKFFKIYSLNVHSCKLNYCNSSLSIYVSYQQNVSSVSLVSHINKIQKIKLIKKKNFTQKISKKNYNNILKTIKNCHNYENLNYKKNLLKKKIVFNKNLKLKRIKNLKFYKKYLSLKANKNIKNLIFNTFLNHLFDSLTLFYKKLVDITLILQPLNSNLYKKLTKKQHSTLKKKLVKLKKYQRHEFFKEGINSMFSSVNKENSAELISKFISTNLQKLKRHNFFIRFIKTILTMFVLDKELSNVKGIKIKIKGRINGVPRAKNKMITIGNMSLLTIESNISYSETTSYTPNGTVGVKVWVCEKSQA